MTGCLQCCKPKNAFLQFHYGGASLLRVFIANTLLVDPFQQVDQSISHSMPRHWSRYFIKSNNHFWTLLLVLFRIFLTSMFHTVRLSDWLLVNSRIVPMSVAVGDTIISCSKKIKGHNSYQKESWIPNYYVKLL